MSGPIIHREFAQHSPEWYAIKAGKYSASKAATIMGKLTNVGIADLVMDLAWERVYGPSAGGYQSKAMQRGTDTEAEARDWYAFETNELVEEVGFVEHASIPHVGWSPDGLVGGLSAVEIKCPLHKGWMEVEESRKVPPQYRWQVKWAMWVGQLDRLAFVSYHPDAGGVIVECKRDPADDDQMAARVAVLEKQVARYVERLTERKEAA